MWYRTFTNAIKVKIILVLLSLLIIGNIALNYFILRPSENVVHSLEDKLKQATDTYIQLTAADTKGISHLLEVEVETLKQKQERLDSSLLYREQIPLFVSKLEKQAERSGLKVVSDLKNEKSSNSAAIESVSLKLKFTGSFEDVVNFIRNLESWNEVLLINDFRIKTNREARGYLSGLFEFTLLISNK